MEDIQKKYLSQMKSFILDICAARHDSLLTTWNELCNTQRWQREYAPNLLYIKEVFYLDALPYFLLSLTYFFQTDYEVATVIRKTYSTSDITYDITIMMYRNIDQLPDNRFTSIYDLIHMNMFFKDAIQEDVQHTSYKLKADILYFITSGQLPGQLILSLYCASDVRFAPILTYEYYQLAHELNTGKDVVVYTPGGCGGHSLFYRYVNEYGQPLILFNASIWLLGSETQRMDTLYSALFFAILSNAFIVFEEYDAGMAIYEPFIRKQFHQSGKAYIILTTRATPLAQKTIILPRTLMGEDMNTLYQTYCEGSIPITYHLNASEIITICDDVEAGYSIKDALYHVEHEKCLR